MFIHLSFYFTIKRLQIFILKKLLEDWRNKKQISRSYPYIYRQICPNILKVI